MVRPLFAVESRVGYVFVPAGALRPGDADLLRSELDGEQAGGGATDRCTWLRPTRRSTAVRRYDRSDVDFFIRIIASNARLAAAGSGSVMAFVRAIGVICQDTPHLSLHQLHAPSLPPLETIAFQ